MSAPSTFSAIQKLRSLLTREEKFKWLGIILFALCVSLLEVITAFVIFIFAQVLNQPDVGQKYLGKLGFSMSLAPGHVVFYASIILGAVYLIKNLVAAVEIFYQNFAIQKMNYHFKIKMLNFIQERPYEYHKKKGSVASLELIGSDVEQMFSVGMTVLALSLSEIMTLFLLIFFVFFINFKLALFASGIFLILYFCAKKYLFKRSYLWGKQVQYLGLESNKRLLELFHGLKEVVLYNKSSFFIKKFSEFAFQKKGVQFLQNTIPSMPRLIFEWIFVFIIIFITWFYTYSTYDFEGLISILSVCAYVGFRAMPGLNRIINNLSNFNSSIPSISRIYDELLSGKSDNTLVNCPEFKFYSKIQIKNVSFKYGDHEQDALSHVSLEIKKGEKIGIVGETGSGKSTLVDVILGLLKPYEGSVLIDEKYPVDSYEWHKKIGYVPQAIYLINDTIEANIAFGEDKIDSIKLNAAIDAAQLRKFINQLQDAEKTIVGERGVRLSGGERQRIAIARALYHNPEVLIFDEATSALDNKTEAQLMDTINMVSKEHTVIMIAHRLTTLKQCDRIVVMEKSIIKEITRYENLTGGS